MQHNHHQEAANHHQEAHKHYQAGNDEKPAREAHSAGGHHSQAHKYAEHAAKKHSEKHR